MLIAALFAGVRNRKQSKCSSAFERTKNVVPINKGILFSHEEMKVLSFAAAAWMEMIKSEITQAQKDKSHMISFIYGI